MLIVLAGATYLAYNLNLLGPMAQMTNAAWGQGLEIGKQKLREFLQNNETARAAISMPARDSDSISLDTLNSRGQRARTSSQPVDDNDDDF